MALVIIRKDRIYIIEDFVIMLLVYLLTYGIGMVAKKALQKLIRRHKAKQKLQQPSTGGLFGELRLPSRGGSNFDLDLVDENELALTILHCIHDGYSYLVHDKRLTAIIFKLIRAKMANQSLVISTNLMRFIALKMLKPEESIWEVGINNIVLTDNRNRLIVRVLASIAVGLANLAIGSLFYGLLGIFMAWDGTEYCGMNCDRYFEQLPKPSEHITRVYSRQPNGNLIISGNDESRQVEIVVPSTMHQIIEGNSQDVAKRPRSRVKAKRVDFSDIVKNDPVLGAFDQLEEPDVPQRECKFKEYINKAVDFD